MSACRRAYCDLRGAFHFHYTIPIFHVGSKLNKLSRGVMLRYFVRPRARVRPRRWGQVTTHKGRPVLVARHLGSSSSSTSLSASVSGRLDDDTKDAIVRMRSAASSSFSVIVEKAREGDGLESGEQDRKPTELYRTPSNYRRRPPPRIVLAGKEAVGDMEGDDIEQLLSTVGKGEVWR